MDPLKIKVIVGSTRQGRFGEHAARWIAGIATAHPELQVETLDLRDYPLPWYDDAKTPSAKAGVYEDPKVTAWAHKIAEADGFIITAAEYNHGYTAVLKNALDYLNPEWHNKPVAFVGYGSVGGARVVEQLREVSVELQMAPIAKTVHIMAPWMLVNDKNELNAGALDGYTKAGEALVEQLTWWAKALKVARG